MQIAKLDKGLEIRGKEDGWTIVKGRVGGRTNGWKDGRKNVIKNSNSMRG